MKQTRAEGFSAKELMIVAAAREIMNGDLVFIGVGAPLASAYLALMTHAPRSRILVESGIVDSVPVGAPISIADPRLAYRCAKTCGGFYTLSLLQRGYVDVSLLGGAEVDKYGNINSTVIGNYRRPKIRLPGSGGANDAASHSKRFVILIPHEKRRFPERVSFLTSPGYINGPNARREAGLTRGGPSRVITSLAVLGFDKLSKTMKLESVHPGVSVNEIESNTGFKLVIPRKIHTTKPPTTGQLKLLRSKIDPDGFLSREHRLQNQGT